jgi:hypothetical protein
LTTDAEALLRADGPRELFDAEQPDGDPEAGSSLAAAFTLPTGNAACAFGDLNVATYAGYSDSSAFRRANAILEASWMSKHRTRSSTISRRFVLRSEVNRRKGIQAVRGSKYAAGASVGRKKSRNAPNSKGCLPSRAALSGSDPQRVATALRMTVRADARNAESVSRGLSVFIIMQQMS